MGQRYLIEPFDGSDRYATEHYQGAAGRNWWTCDPTLRLLMRRHLGDDGLAWAEPHLDRLGALMGGPVAAWAEETDRNPPRLEKYDKWGRDVSQVVMPPSFHAARDALMADNLTSPAFAEQARAHGADPAALAAAWTYLLDQADIGMGCALGTGGDMVVSLAERYAPADVRDRVRAIFAHGFYSGEAAQMLTERTGGSDLAALEATAVPDPSSAGEAWRLTGLKWFASNANGSAFVVLARAATGDGDTVAPFLVLWERRDGSRNGVRIRRLKDKLGTRSVASAEVEFADAEAFLLAGAPGAGSPGAGASGLGTMMKLTNASRLGVAMMGLGVARRALVESICYARAREAFGRRLIDQPLMRRKLAELIVEVEAVQALVFDGHVGPRLRLAPALVKLRATRLGLTAASDAVEIHGGNGYIEQWPVARLLRDAQVNPIWEGGDNILCLDVRRAMLRENAHEPFLDRLEAAVAQAPEGSGDLVRARIGDLRKAITVWSGLDPEVAEARLYPLAQLMADVYAAALLLEQAGWEQRELGTDRKALVARLYAEAHLADHGPLRGLDRPAEDLDRFGDLLEGAVTL
ncbi:acyl-CoA dehydrogenase family protein [Nonomuraea roseoviolacea]|uniref:Alkylation response protein AidB-like acyl-CoA dehydrogenase n=1 Tax=Nonomuraea roseoviolacea subsp. carminata TaxID=160689 RepID=A0ABT1K8Q1_9ACTN|nr:acyl-CoA dehydrogenase family protein [Nonomuraea roseoviolacea]MCP2350387.1 alkylation response protein AidB-like acyl-CoA dehydrogenase [Nonomuraea roseoviolacea subsp. carminata]